MKYRHLINSLVSSMALGSAGHPCVRGTPAPGHLEHLRRWPTPSAWWHTSAPRAARDSVIFYHWFFGYVSCVLLLAKSEKNVFTHKKFLWHTETFTHSKPLDTDIFTHIKHLHSAKFCTQTFSLQPLRTARVYTEKTFTHSRLSHPANIDTQQTFTKVFYYKINCTETT